MKRTEHIALKGQISQAQLAKYNDIVMQDNVKTIDITGFSVSDASDNDLILDYMENECEPDLIVKLLLNKCYSNQFVISGNSVLSADGRAIIHSFNKKYVSIPAGVEIIGNLAYCACRLSNLNIPEGIKEIGCAAFYASCEGKSDLILPDTVEVLGEQAFSSCSVETVKLSCKLQSIPDGCFEYNNIDEIVFPSSVKHIGSDAFHCNTIKRVILPEGVESIGWNVFTHINGYIYFPSTMRKIEKDFFYEECVDDPQDCIPYIEVNENNPVFFSKNGTLYAYDNPDVPYLGYEYKEEVPEAEPALITFPNTHELSKEYTVDEIMKKFRNCKPIDDDNTMFWIYELEKGYNIIDRHLHYYVNQNVPQDIKFSKNNFILIRTSYFKGIIYSIDLKRVLLGEYDDYSFGDCDDAGRIYVFKYVEVPEDRLRIHYFNKTTQRAGCITLDKQVIIPCYYWGYKHLDRFNENGIAIAVKGSKYGVIDTKNQIVIPFDYTSFYRPFNDDGIAIVSKKVKGSERYFFITDKNELVGTFIESGFHLHEEKFHIYEYAGKYGYTKQFGAHRTKAVYSDIRIIDDKTIEVSREGINYETIKYQENEKDI